MKKRCGTCQTTLPLESFSRNRARNDGLNDRCKACCKSSYEANREILRLRSEANTEAVVCNTCGQPFDRRVGRKGRECNPCRNRRIKVPCPTCAGPMKRYASSCAGCRDVAGTSNPRWTGGRTYGQDGYVRVRVDGVYLLEHRHVMQQHIGRPLLPGENVHHINGVKDDNRTENLELWTRGQPSGVRAIDVVAWAREVLDTYEPLEQAGLI